MWLEKFNLPILFQMVCCKVIKDITCDINLLLLEVKLMLVYKQNLVSFNIRLFFCFLVFLVLHVLQENNVLLLFSSF